MAPAHALDGPANEGFTTDISLVDPSLPRTITPRISRSRTRSRTVTSRVPADGASLEGEQHEEQDAVNDEDSQDDLMDLATSKVSGFRMR
jgi:hypothetical protein